MAFPNNIKTTGALSQNNDIFEYFRGGLLESATSSNTNREQWPCGENSNGDIVSQFFLSSATGGYIGANTVLPITRAQLYDYFGFFTQYPNSVGFYNSGFSVTLNGSNLYTQDNPQSDWTRKQLTDWAKMKCIELALFGNVTNGGSTTNNSLSTFNGQTLRVSVNNWRINDLAYLRCALVHFDDYGQYTDNMPAQRPAPTSVTVNVSNRTVNWTNSSGFGNDSHEYSINGADWIQVSTKPVNVGADAVGIGGFRVRLRGDGLYSPSAFATNNTAIPGQQFTINVSISAARNISNQNEIQVSTYASANGNLPTTLSIDITMSVNSQLVVQTVTILSGTQFGFNQTTVFESFIQDPIQITNVNAIPSPSSINGQPVIVNTQIM